MVMLHPFPHELLLHVLNCNLQLQRLGNGHRLVLGSKLQQLTEV